MSAFNQARHDYLRYAQVWEDYEVLLQGLRPAPGDQLLSVASAGDQVLALLLADPARICAVDVNPAQLHLLALKMAAFQHLDYPDMVQFLGYRPGNSRMALYRRLRPYLSAPARRYWDTQTPALQKGIIHQGKLERYFRLFRRFVLPLIHSRPTIKALLQPRSPQEQAIFYREIWATWRWKCLFRLFFSKPLLGWLGRDPAFLDQVTRPVDVALLDATARQLSGPEAHQNPFLQYILTGSRGNDLPPYVRPEAFEVIGSRLDRIELVQGWIEEAGQGRGPFNGFNLSDIFEYQGPAALAAMVPKLADLAAPGARLSYWTLLVERDITAFDARLAPLLRMGEARQDKGFFYASFQTDIRL